MKGIKRLFSYRFSFIAYCREPLGLASGLIEDYQLTASSAYNSDFNTFGPHRARLNLMRWPQGYRASASHPANPWIKVDLNKEMVITAVATQGYGDPSVEEWPVEYNLMYSKDFESDLLPLRDSDGQPKVRFTSKRNFTLTMCECIFEVLEVLAGYNFR